MLYNVLRVARFLNEAEMHGTYLKTWNGFKYKHQTKNQNTVLGTAEKAISKGTSYDFLIILFCTFSGSYWSTRKGDKTLLPLAKCPWSYRQLNLCTDEYFLCKRGLLIAQHMEPKRCEWSDSKSQKAQHGPITNLALPTQNLPFESGKPCVILCEALLVLAEP